MAEMTEPVLDIDRVFLLDRRNQKFVEKSSPDSARVQDARQSLGGLALILTFVGALLFVTASTHLVDTQLVKSGKVTTGVITSKHESHQSGYSCYVTYRFSAPSSYEREANVSERVCSILAVGQAVEVLYDPRQPLSSNLKVSVERPKYPVELVAPFFLLALCAVYSQFVKFRQERRLCAQGKLICGSLVSKNIDLDLLTMQYRFPSPAGFTIESNAQGSVRRSNWSSDSRFFPDKPDLVAVLFLSDSEFYLL